MRIRSLVALSGCLFACSDTGPVITDSRITDSGITDSGITDSGITDSGITDSGITDSGITDSGITDSGITDSGTVDGGVACLPESSQCIGAGLIQLCRDDGQWAALPASPQPLSTTSNMTPPIVTARNAEMQAGRAAAHPDGPLVFLSKNTSTVTLFDATPFTEVQALYSYSDAGAPMETLVALKTLCRQVGGFCVDSAPDAGFSFTQFNGISGVTALWVVNAYWLGEGAALGLVHEECAGHSVGACAGGPSRIGLAITVDEGQTWKYLGRIIKPFGDPANWNIQGAPYVIHGGQMYIYYTDRTAAGVAGWGVSRASLAEVVAAARAGNVGTNLWHKWQGGCSWSAGGSDDASVSAALLEGLPALESSHTQAGVSTTTGRTTLVGVKMTWGAPADSDTRVDLYEAASPVGPFEKTLTLAAEPQNAQGSFIDATQGGYHYCSLMDADGQSNSLIGNRFHVYCQKYYDIRLARPMGLYRWTIDTAGMPNVSRHGTTAFDSIQGPEFFDQEFLPASAAVDLTWNNAGLWVSATDPFLTIAPEVMTVGTRSFPVVTWVAPRSGRVRIMLTARMHQPNNLVNHAPEGGPCGDGVFIGAHDGTQAFLDATLTGDDTVGTSLDKVMQVTAGQSLTFYVYWANANNYCDQVYYEPWIQYL